MVRFTFNEEYILMRSERSEFGKPADCPRCSRVSKKELTFFPLNFGACFDSGRGKGTVTGRLPVVTFAVPEVLLMVARPCRYRRSSERGRSGEVLGEGKEAERRIGCRILELQVVWHEVVDGITSALIC